MEWTEPINEGEVIIWALAILDNILFIKNGYLIMKHIIPIMIESLLILVLSISDDDLLLRLVNSLDQRTYFPAILLTLFSLIIYYSSVLSLVKKAYLLSNFDYLRSLMTSVTSILICLALVLVVLNLGSIKQENYNSKEIDNSHCVNVENGKAIALELEIDGVNYRIKGTNLWACLLVVLLSLLGIGWSAPNSLIELTGINSTDYKDGRSNAKKISDVLTRIKGIREPDLENKTDLVGEFNDAISELTKSIDENIEFEPSWERTKLKKIKENLNILAKQGLNTDVELSVACTNFEELKYGQFRMALSTLAKVGVI